MIRVVLPQHLQTLAWVDGEVSFDVAGPVTQQSVLDALATRHPMLKGTIRDHVTLNRRALFAFSLASWNLSHESAYEPLPEAVATGNEPLLIVGAMAGG